MFDASNQLSFIAKLQLCPECSTTVHEFHFKGVLQEEPFLAKDGIVSSPSFKHIEEWGVLFSLCRRSWIWILSQDIMQIYNHESEV